MREDSEPSLPSRRGHVIYVKAQVRAFARSIAVGKSNVVQEANVGARRMTLYPTRTDWDAARSAAKLISSGHDDMHAGELEVSLLLHVAPHLVRKGFEQGDHEAPDRTHLLLHGMAAYTTSGVIGYPSGGSAAKGAALLESLTASFAEHLAELGHIATP